MNILHHKSWHVRNKDNIKKVRRDEAKAAEEEKERQKKIAIAESEARINFLRSSKNENKSVALEDFTSHDHVNLFEQEEKGTKYNQDKNEEVEQDKKKEQEAYEKKIGVLKYLVDDDLDLKNQPWYKTIGPREIVNAEDDVEIDVKIKRSLDPLKTIEDLTGGSERKKHKKKHKKEKHKEKDDKKRPKSIEELRAERLKREGEERLKAQRLISGNQNLGKPAEQKIEADDRKRRYNNQFNPDISKF
ncbi:unnamed protein product [Brachionus calyciflorus]|uniref:CBF1-interacting co-repressor CIR N-terminal domain-containing protein n=1 Tax=Brachionus calyciflorus TaxID=104777 RepID=A0A813XP43_9BILA|nr:unnamed protein product [Brachionus calyciflorus]